MTLAEWKRALHPGQRLVCTYRWYWGKAETIVSNTGTSTTTKPAPEGGREEITVREVKATQLIYSTPDKPRIWMQFPRASELKANDKGFELYFPTGPEWRERSGILMSRYEWVNECSCGDAEDQRILGGPSPSWRVHGVGR
jgi:hypothetical protein